MQKDLIAKMRSRADKCRLLSRSTSDPRAAKILRDMAEEIESDLKRLTENDSD